MERKELAVELKYNGFIVVRLYLWFKDKHGYSEK